MALALGGVAGIALVAGLVLLVLGWRGKRVDDHPLCRACGFDLHGAGDEPERCPECGGKPGEVGTRRGNRRRSRPKLLVGTSMVLLSLLVLGTMAGAAASGANVYQYKPMWLLLWEGERELYYWDSPALDEIARRTQAGLDEETAERVLEAALAAQADKARPWNVTWGDIADSVFQGGHGTAEQWERYARGIVDLETRHKLEIGPDGWLALELVSDDARSGNQSWYLQARLTGLWIDDERVIERDGPIFEEQREWPDAYGDELTTSGWLTPTPWLEESGVRLPFWVSLDAEPGQHSVRATWIVAALTKEQVEDFWVSAENRAFGAQATVSTATEHMEDWVRRTPIAEQTIEWEGEVTVVPGLDVNVSGTARVLPLTITATRVHAMNAPWGADVYVDLQFDILPSSCAFEVCLDDGNREWLIGYANMYDNEGHSRWLSLTQHLTEFDADKVTIVLRHSEEAAKRGVHRSRIRPIEETRAKARVNWEGR